MPVPQPDAASRWRCTVCGNLTRFDVTRSTRAREYVHVDLSGAPVVEEREVLHDVVEQVACRWCGAVDKVAVVPRPGADEGDGGSAAGAATGSVGGPS